MARMLHAVSLELEVAGSSIPLDAVFTASLEHSLLLI